MKTALLFLLLAPGAKKEWSKAHDVAIRVPSSWKIVARDQGDRAFVVHGPQLGPGNPTAVLWNAGGAAKRTLDQKADELAAAVKKRAGWRVVARARKSLGPFPSVRIGIAFLERGKKGRARFTVILMGGRFFVLEMNAAASHFPGPAFDRIEKSVEVRWEARSLEAGLTLKTPHGWLYEAEGGRCAIYGPALGHGPTILRLGVGKVPARMLEGATPGPKLTFFGKTRATQVHESKLDDGTLVRRLHIHVEGVTAILLAPVPAWEDTFSTAAAILAGVKRPKADRTKDSDK